MVITSIRRQQDRSREVGIFASGPESVAGNGVPRDPGRMSGEEQQAPHYPTLTGCPEDALIGSLDKVTEPHMAGRWRSKSALEI